MCFPDTSMDRARLRNSISFLEDVWESYKRFKGTKLHFIPQTVSTSLFELKALERTLTKLEEHCESLRQHGNKSRL